MVGHRRIPFFFQISCHIQQNTDTPENNIIYLIRTRYARTQTEVDRTGFNDTTFRNDLFVLIQ